MGLFRRKPKRPTWIEWRESPIEVPLYPLEGYQGERDALLDARGGHLRNFWGFLRAVPTARGKYAGQPCIQVTVDGKPVGEVKAKDRERFADLFAAVIEHGVTVGVVRVEAYAGTEGGTLADLYLGPYKYQPARPDWVTDA